MASAKGRPAFISEYFLTAPTHGRNTAGTCTVIAAQLLLSYNNYYNDRRIIANANLNAQNPNNVVNPMTMTNQVLGSTQGYHDFISNTYMTGATWLTTAETWLRTLLNDRNAQIVGNINFTVGSRTTGNTASPLAIASTDIISANCGCAKRCRSMR